MKRWLPLLLALVALWSWAQPALAQGETTRIVILPFSVPEGSEALVFGLPTALQRSLNTVDGWFVPPVGDAALLSNRALEAGLDVSETLLDLFDADVLISGQARAGDAAAASLVLVGPSVVTPELTVSAGGPEPSDLVQAVVDAVLTAVDKSLSASERRELERMVAQTPSLPSLGAVAITTAGLPGARSGDLQIASELDPGSSWIRAELSRALLRIGRSDDALFAAVQATELLEADPDAWTVLGVVHLSAGRIDEAVAAFDRALELNPSYAFARAGRGNALGSTDDYARAADAYPRLVDAHLGLAAAESDLARSLQILRRAARYLPESVQLHRAALGRALGAGDPTGASAYLRTALDTPLGASPSLYALAVELPATQIGTTRALIEEGIKVFPGDAGLQLLAAKLDLESGAVEVARERLEPLYAQAPNDPEVANLLALVRAREGDIEGAMVALMGVSADNVAAERNLAILLLEAGRSRQALEILEPALAAEPDDARLATYTAIALGGVGRQDEAVALLRDVLIVNPGFDLAERALAVVEQQSELIGGGSVAFEGEAGAAFERGLFALQEERFIEAAVAFEEARAADDHPLLAFYHGYALQLTGRARDAVPAYQRALEDLPDSDTIHNNLGYAHLQLGRLDLAIPEFETALALNAQNSRAHLNLGLAYFELARYRDALDSWNRAVALAPALENEIANLRTEANARLGSQ